MERDKDRISALRRRVLRILAHSNGWHAWQTALESALYSEQITTEGHRFVYCVDASEVVEYLAPSSLVDEDREGENDPERGEEYPTPLDLSLLISFKPGQPVFMLPPHILELRNLTGVWVERARMVREKLAMLQEALQIYEARLRDLQSESDDGIEQFVQFVLREGRSFGLIFWLSSEGERSLDAVTRRLQVPNRAVLDLPENWTYQPDEKRIETWYRKLEETGLGSGGQASNRRDAHALYFLSQVNEEMPESSFLVLFTHSGKIWKVVEEDRKNARDGEHVLWKGRKEGEEEGTEGLSLIQRPQVALIRKLLDEAEEGPERDELRQQLALERMRNQSLSELRGKLEHEVLPRLAPRAASRPDLDQVERLVKDLEDGLQRLESISLDRQRLERTRLALESTVGEQGPLGRLRQVIKGKRGEELKSILQKELGDVLKALDKVQQKLSLAASVIPDTSLSFEGFEDHESSVGVRGILRSRPGGMAYTIHFQSPPVEQHLEKLEGLLRHLDATRKKDDERKASGAERKEHERAIQLDLQREMYECKVRLQNEPEYYLLLAFIYSSRQMWFQAFLAADQGLRMIQEKESPEGAESPRLEIASAWTELLLAKAVAFANWTLEGYTELPYVAAGFLGQAAGLIRKSLQNQQRWSTVLPYYKGRDPRCLRELGIIHGAAREAGFDLAVDREDCVLAGLPVDPRPSLLDLFLAFSRAAYEEVKGQKTEHEEIWTAYENSLLYALTECDREDGLEERKALADALRRRPETWKEAKFLDTLAWHHFSLAQRCRRIGQPFDGELKVASWFIGQALGLLNEKNTYYTRLLREHQRQIDAFSQG
jgi:hypothetical protein